MVIATCIVYDIAQTENEKALPDFSDSVLQCIRQLYIVTAFYWLPLANTSVGGGCADMGNSCVLAVIVCSCHTYTSCHQTTR